MKNINIKQKVIKLKREKKNIGLCHGVFDVLHFGHILHFKAAKKKCDYLFVSITEDQFIKKGPNRPVHNQFERLDILKNIKMIDQAFIAKGESGVESINLVRPDIYFKGNDYIDNKTDKTGKILLEKKALKKNKGKIFYTTEKQMSSSKIINNQHLSLNKEQSNFLKLIQNKFSYNQILQIIKKIKKTKALVIGDFIIDKYIFGNVQGKSGKEPHMVFNKIKESFYLGGSAIIANHLSSFVNKVTLLSDFGHEKNIKKIINENLKKNIKHIAIKPFDSLETCIKTRFVDLNSNYKLFGSYYLPNLNNKFFHSTLSQKIKQNIHAQDTIILADYSNNFFNVESLNLIKKSKKFIAGMAQKNSNKSSFHTLDHLKSIDLLCINEGELRNELRDKKSDYIKLSKFFIKKYKIKYLVVTRGIQGSILITRKFKIYSCPSFNSKPIDKVGAGDAMLSILSLFLKNKIDINLSLMIASLIAGKVVNNLGNNYSANILEIERDLEYLLK